MSLLTPLKRARNLGSAKDGTRHWWVQRLTALALIPLTIWFVVSLLTVVGGDFDTARAWIASPYHGAFMLLFVVLTFYHAALGMQVIIEDYVHHHQAKILTLALTYGILLTLGFIASVAVLKIMLGSF